MKWSVWSAAALAGVVCLTQPAAGQAWQDAGAPVALGRTPMVEGLRSSEEVSWHVRAALNVAALGCRDGVEQQTIAAYNRLLARQRAPLAAADAGLKAQYRARYGAGWESRHDRDMTRVYNLFARPWAHAAFCAEAQEVLAEADSVQPGEFAEFAAYALARLETPFQQAVPNQPRIETAWSVSPRIDAILP